MKRKFIGLIILVLLAVVCGCAHKAPEQKSPQEMFDKAAKLETKGKKQQAIDAYMEVRTIYPAHALAKKSLLEVATLYYGNKEYESALDHYKEFSQLYPTDPEVDLCLYQTGMCHYKQMEAIDRDQNETIYAINSFKELFERYPSSPYTKDALEKTKDAQTKLVKHYLYIGKFYLKKKNYTAACNRFQEAKDLFPEIAKNEGVDALLSDACKEHD